MDKKLILKNKRKQLLEEVACIDNELKNITKQEQTVDAEIQFSRLADEAKQMFEVGNIYKVNDWVGNYYAFKPVETPNILISKTNPNIAIIHFKIDGLHWNGTIDNKIFIIKVGSRRKSIANSGTPLCAIINPQSSLSSYFTCESYSFYSVHHFSSKITQEELENKINTEYNKHIASDRAQMEYYQKKIDQYKRQQTQLQANIIKFVTESSK